MSHEELQNKEFKDAGTQTDNAVWNEYVKLCKLNPNLLAKLPEPSNSNTTAIAKPDNNKRKLSVGHINKPKKTKIIKPTLEVVEKSSDALKSKKVSNTGETIPKKEDNENN